VASIMLPRVAMSDRPHEKHLEKNRIILAKYLKTSAFPWPQAYAQHLDIPGNPAHDNAKRLS